VKTGRFNYLLPISYDVECLSKKLAVWAYRIISKLTAKFAQQRLKKRFIECFILVFSSMMVSQNTINCK